MLQVEVRKKARVGDEARNMAGNRGIHDVSFKHAKVLHDVTLGVHVISVCVCVCPPSTIDHLAN